MCLISFDIYGMKSNEGHFHLRTVLILDKLYQEINFKSNLNSVFLWK